MSEVYVDGIRYLPAHTHSGPTKPFGLLITEARERKSETLQEAANNIGTSKSHLWTMENGGCFPRLYMLQNVLNYYGILFEDIDMPNKDSGVGDE